jgi:hypothetical protein
MNVKKTKKKEKEMFIPVAAVFDLKNEKRENILAVFPVSCVQCAPTSNDACCVSALKGMRYAGKAKIKESKRNGAPSFLVSFPLLKRPKTTTSKPFQKEIPFPLPP